MTHTPATPLTGNAPIPLTAEELAEIERRANEATAGGQLARYDHGGGRLAIFDGDNRDLIADFYDEANREFYFHARTDIPALLSTLRTRESEIERLRETIRSRNKMLDRAWHIINGRASHDERELWRIDYGDRVGWPIETRRAAAGETGEP